MHAGASISAAPVARRTAELLARDALQGAESLIRTMRWVELQSEIVEVSLKVPLCKRK